MTEPEHMYSVHLLLDDVLCVKSQVQGVAESIETMKRSAPPLVAALLLPAQHKVDDLLDLLHVVAITLRAASLSGEHT